MMSGPAVLFVGNLPTVADSQYVERLFSAYGRVLQAKVLQEGTTPYAEVTYSSVDDADTAIAALHALYCASPVLPLVVLYHRNSPAVSAYGRHVGSEYATAVRNRREPVPVPLEAFDDGFERTDVSPLPPDKAILDGNEWNSHHSALIEGKWTQS